MYCRVTTLHRIEIERILFQISYLRPSWILITQSQGHCDHGNEPYFQTTKAMSAVCLIRTIRDILGQNETIYHTKGKEQDLAASTPSPPKIDGGCR